MFNTETDHFDLPLTSNVTDEKTWKAQILLKIRKEETEEEITLKMCNINVELKFNRKVSENISSNLYKKKRQ